MLLAAAELRLIVRQAVVFSSRVIVGSLSHPTPEFNSQVEAITFNPWWRVPRSIAVKEILPALRRQPNYLAKHNMLIADRPHDPYGLTIDWSAVTAKRFSYQIRQRPGPDNALGQIKFDGRLRVEGIRIVGVQNII